MNTREEQIIKASQLYAKHLQKPFMDGAMWADAHPNLYSVTRKSVERERKYLIREACDWLRANLQNYWSQSVTAPEKFINDFMQYMKEKQ